MFSWEGTNVAVTGGAGFIGSRLADKLISLGANVKIIDSRIMRNSAIFSNKLSKIQFIQGNLKNQKFIRNAIRETEVVFDLASKLGDMEFINDRPASILSENIRILLETIEVAKANADRYFFASSSNVYGTKTPTPHGEDDADFNQSVSAYGWSKIIGEEFTKTYYEEYGLKTYVARLFNVYGPQENFKRQSSVVTKFILNTLSGKPLVIYGDGKQTRDFTFITDIVDGIIKIVESSHFSIPFNLGTGCGVTINELADLVIRLCQPKIQLKKKYKPAIPNEIKYSVANNQRAKQLLGWAPKVELKNGLMKAIDWHRSELQ